MKLINFSLLSLIIVFPISIMMDQFVFFIILFLSILPINILHGNRHIKDFHRDKTTYTGLKILTYPLIIFFFLTLTHHRWMEYILN